MDLLPNTPGPRRRLLALGLNLVAPGAGLVLLQRPWLGLVLAMLFALVAQAALWGLLLVPAAAPPYFAPVAAGLAIAVWALAQALAWSRARLICGTFAADTLRNACTQAAQAESDGRYADAYQLLMAARTLNDEDLAVNVQCARLMAVMGRFADARCAWRRILRLDREGRFRKEAVTTLERLPD